MIRFLHVPPAKVLEGQVLIQNKDEYKVMDGDIVIQTGKIVEVHKDLVEATNDQLILMIQKFRNQLRQMTNIQMLLRAWQKSRSYWLYYSMRVGDQDIFDLAEYNSIEGAHSKVDQLKDEAKIFFAELHYAIIEGIEREDDDGPYSPQVLDSNIVEPRTGGSGTRESEDDVFTSGVPTDPKCD